MWERKSQRMIRKNKFCSRIEHGKHLALQRVLCADAFILMWMRKRVRVRAWWGQRMETRRKKKENWFQVGMGDTCTDQEKFTVRTHATIQCCFLNTLTLRWSRNREREMLIFTVSSPPASFYWAWNQIPYSIVLAAPDKCAACTFICHDVVWCGLVQFGVPRIETQAKRSEVVWKLYDWMLFSQFEDELLQKIW